MLLDVPVLVVMCLSDQSETPLRGVSDLRTSEVGAVDILVGGSD